MKDRFPSLPPGVTPADIDDHFGVNEDNGRIYYTETTVGVSVELPDSATEQDVTDAIIDYLKDNPPDDVHDVEIIETDLPR
jgi:hypothetical protein